MQALVIKAQNLRCAGTWQEYCIAPVDKVYAVPDSLSNQLAAIMWSNPVLLPIIDHFLQNRKRMNVELWMT